MDRVSVIGDAARRRRLPEPLRLTPVQSGKTWTGDRGGGLALFLVSSLGQARWFIPGIGTFNAKIAFISIIFFIWAIDD